MKAENCAEITKKAGKSCEKSAKIGEYLLDFGGKMLYDK